MLMHHGKSQPVCDVGRLYDVWDVRRVILVACCGQETSKQRDSAIANTQYMYIPRIIVWRGDRVCVQMAIPSAIPVLALIMAPVHRLWAVEYPDKKLTPV